MIILFWDTCGKLAAPWIAKPLLSATESAVFDFEYLCGLVFARQGHHLTS